MAVASRHLEKQGTFAVVLLNEEYNEQQDQTLIEKSNCSAPKKTTNIVYVSYCNLWICCTAK